MLYSSRPSVVYRQLMQGFSSALYSTPGACRKRMVAEKRGLVDVKAAGDSSKFAESLEYECDAMQV